MRYTGWIIVAVGAGAVVATATAYYFRKTRRGSKSVKEDGSQNATHLKADIESEVSQEETIFCATTSYVEQHVESNPCDCTHPSNETHHIPL